MIEIQESVSLERPADEVFLYLADFRNLPKWDPGIVRATMTSEGEPRVGASFDVVATFLGRRVPMRYRMAKHDPRAREAELVGEADGLVATDTIRVAERGNGCVVTWHASFELGGMSRFAAPLMRPLFVRLGRNAMNGMRRALG